MRRSIRNVGVLLGLMLAPAGGAVSATAQDQASVEEREVSASKPNDLDWILGGNGQESQFTDRVEELLEENEAARAGTVFPVEPKGLLVTGANRKVSEAVTLSLSEVALAVSATDTRRIAVGANVSTPSGFRQAMFVSTDGGDTFVASQLPTTSPFAFLQSDPTLAWTEDDTLWAATIEGQIGGGLQLKGQSFRSDDGGATWTFAGGFSGTERIADRPVLWVDSSPFSSYRGSLYVIWHNGPVWVSRRSPGATAWSPAVRLSPTDTHGFGGDLKTDIVGRIYSFWPDTTRNTIFVSTSDDGGAVFSPPVAVAPIQKPFSQLNVAAAGRSPLNHVSAAVWKRLWKRRAFVAWYDPAIPPATGARVWFAASDDGGATWTPPREVQPVAGAADQFHPALTLDGITGRLALSYTDTSGDPTALTTRRVVVTSNDFGDSWNAPKALSTERSDVLAAPAQIYGDYQSMVSHGARNWAAWTDRRTEAATSVWLAEFRTTPFGILSVPIGGPKP